MSHFNVFRRRIARLLVLPGVLILGCKAAPPPERIVTVSNAGFHLDQLFTDPRGYTIFRFYDEGDWRYYVVGPDGQSQMLPTTRTVHDTTAALQPGLGVGLGVGGRIDGGGHRR